MKKTLKSERSASTYKEARRELNNNKVFNGTLTERVYNQRNTIDSFMKAYRQH